MIAGIVYFVCAATSALCVWMLFAKYRRSRVGLLFWSGICFVGLALNNVLLCVDLLVGSEYDLSLARIVPAVAGIMVLIGGLIWDT